MSDQRDNRRQARMTSPLAALGGRPVDAGTRRAREGAAEMQRAVNVSLASVLRPKRDSLRPDRRPDRPAPPREGFRG